MKPPAKPFSLLIKPASADCNQNCVYCFYLNRADPYPGRRRRMSAEVLERLVSSYLKTSQPRYTFVWQGGEPTLMGVDFFKEAVKLQRACAAPGSTVVNGLQTNATRIDDEFARFFAGNGFLLGVSLDGPARIHDRYRKYRNGAGSYADVMKGIDCLARNGVEFNILTLVSRANVKKGGEIYRFLCEKGFFYQQYIECVDFDEKGRLSPCSITAEEWGNFLCEVFDEWIKSDVHRVSIRFFDAVLAYLVEKRYTICSMGPACGQYVAVEFNGDVYPCDFFVREDLRIGNIEKNTWRELLESSVLTAFAARKSEGGDPCVPCRYRSLCFGDCPKNRFRFNRPSDGPSWLCQGWKTFYDHALPRFQIMAEEIIRNRGPF